MNGRERGDARRSSRPTVTLLVLACLAGGVSPRSRAAEPEGIAGRVVDRTGEGMATAKVWVVGGSWEEPEALAETTTDGQGAFSFPSFWEEQARKGLRERIGHSYGLVARDGGGRIGWLTSRYRGDTKPIKIELVETGEALGRVVDADGKPVAGAAVVPDIFVRSTSDRSSADYVRLTPALAGPLATTTAEDGSFTLRRIPKGCQVHATLSTRGFGAPRVSWDSTKPVTIALDGRIGRIEGRLVTSDAGILPSELPVSLRRSSPPDDHPGGSFQLLYFKTLKVGGDGRFRFEDVPPGRYAISVDADPDSGYKADPIPEVEVGPDARVAGLNVPLRRLVTIKGRVVDATSGAGVAGVGMSASLLSGQFLQHGDIDETDARGATPSTSRPGKS